MHLQEQLVPHQPAEPPGTTLVATMTAPAPDAYEQGRQAALRGDALSSNPYRMTQGSPTRADAIAFRRGWTEGEKAQDDAADDHWFRG